MKVSDRCTEVVSHSSVKVEENKSRVVFKNPDRTEFAISKIDGCLVTNGVRADYLVTKGVTASVLVELKGTDVAHACDQLLSSVEHPNVKPLLEREIGFLVVCTRYPRLDTFVLKAKQRCARVYKAGFHVITPKGAELDLD